jgi:hypothetical protein
LTDYSNRGTNLPFRKTEALRAANALSEPYNMAGSGAGSRLPTPLLVVAGVSTLVAVLVSTISILLQLRNYRKPALQR